MNKKFFTFAAIMLVALFGMIEPALAQAQQHSVMYVAATKTLQLFQASRTILFIVGGFGLIGIAFAAIFGKMNWKWFAALAIGLAIVAAAGAIVDYATTTTDTNMTGGTLTGGNTETNWGTNQAQ